MSIESGRPENAEVPNGIEIRQLDFGDRTDLRRSPQLLALYRTPALRPHFIAPPLTEQTLIRDYIEGYEVFAAIDPQHGIVGAITLEPMNEANIDTAPAVEIARLGVLPGFRNRKVGSRLLDSGLQRAFAGKATAAVLGILQDVPDWETTRDLYESRGFSEVPEWRRIEPYRDLGQTTEYDQPPLPDAERIDASIIGKQPGTVHYFSFQVPILGMILPKSRYQPRKV